ncbi:ABC transporter permease subunit [Ancylobacter sp. MQZ15Z-1]|uniref:ABC transporter permease subunit n=1 Tax=Ancylobacter mangrovi TaxID=2972472 RepID=A0A9X2T0Y2_9HYPH|nr:ABC transporter permease subunit [Ancylobacter mangrovi]MCS0494420.1 ABC transporter permease subunit [Ancylobacter mangrovi]
MLAGSRAWRLAVWAVVLPLFAVLYGLPIAVIVLASLARTWNGALPGEFTLLHYAEAFRSDSLDALVTSLMTGAIASTAALACGTWAALALRRRVRLPARLLEAVFFVPSAVPSVSVGLGLLVAFSQPPFLLNGTRAIVLIAHFVLVFAFTFGNVTAGLARVPAECEQIAESLGARPFYRLRRVTLPLLTPYLIAAFSLSFALSMGELGATIMVYPPGWVTMPVRIFALSDRGAIFDAATLTTILGVATLIVLTVLSRVSSRAMLR